MKYVMAVLESFSNATACGGKRSIDKSNIVGVSSWN